MPTRSSDKYDQQQFIPPTILTSLIHYAERQRWDYAAWFHDSGLDIEQIQQAQSIVHFNQICNVLSQAIISYQVPDLGLKLGRSEGLIGMGILGFAMQSCKIFADALDIVLRYHRISGSVLNVKYAIQDDLFKCEITERFPCNELQAFFYDEFFSSTITCLDVMLGDHNDVVSLELSYFPSEYQEQYYYTFGCPIQFNSDKNIISFKQNILHRSLKNYSATNYATAIQICERTLKEIDQLNQISYLYLLEHLIEQHLPEHFKIQQAAEHLCISERHLRRQLLSEGLTFQKIRQNVLEHKAKRLLEQNLSMSEISLKLGFSELREFRRAFKRWTGQAPSVYKQTNKLN
ncbi:AraC family transcriptional regulator ligand-binding domain-containing protein [Acinetobacter sp. CE-15]|uniref:AraC family transcriptional regulator n=1 Tax=Acinetobacter sp. CE-15 TaxID=3425693 RepID=UPI003DA3598B